MADSFSSALSRLDPASRALLDLSLRRGMRTEEIADVLGADADSVEQSRDEALRRVAVDVGMGEEDLDEVRARLAELPPEEWLGGAPAPAAVEPGPDPEHEPEPEPASTRRTPLTEGARRRRSVWPALLGMLLLAGVITAIALAAGGEDETGGGGTQAETEETTGGGGGGATPPTPESHEGGVRFEPVGVVEADGRARLTDGGERIEVQIRGLPSPPNGGHYEVWLYSSLIESTSLGRSRQQVVQVDAELPDDWDQYEFIDVSAEPPDENAVHSGQSVARVPTSELAGQ